jgi:hypothetical protein
MVVKPCSREHTCIYSHPQEVRLAKSSVVPLDKLSKTQQDAKQASRQNFFRSQPAINDVELGANWLGERKNVPACRVVYNLNFVRNGIGKC